MKYTEKITRELKEQIIENEGYRQFPYRCSADRLTVGIGRNLDDRGISLAEAQFLLENDILDCIKDLEIIFPGFNELTENRQHVLIDMRFQLGPGRFRGFKNMIAAIRNQNFRNAAFQIGDSLYRKQVPKRANKNIKAMILG